MSREHDKAVMDVLGEPGSGAIEMTFSQLLDETGLLAPQLDMALYRLVRNGVVRMAGCGRYRSLDNRHSKAVKRGLLLSSMPKLAILCGYVAISYPMVEQIDSMSWMVM